MAPMLYDKEPELGDLIEIFRGTYQHWAVYTGDGYVVHLSPPTEVPGVRLSSMRSVFCDKAVVKKEKLSEVVGTNRWRINNCLDETYEPQAVHIIVKDAHAHVGKEYAYCVFSWNCEHFVTDLRYGKAESWQVRRARELVRLVGGLAVGVGLGLVALKSALFGSESKEKTRKCKKHHAVA